MDHKLLLAQVMVATEDGGLQILQEQPGAHVVEFEVFICKHLWIIKLVSIKIATRLLQYW